MVRPQRYEAAPAARRSHGVTTIVGPTHICCGQRLRQHAVEPTESQLSFTYCGRCESLRWFRQDMPLPDDAAPPASTAGLDVGSTHDADTSR